ncbi:acyltransferase domain-containing protein [Cohnella soli]|uniref:Acyltransferase domain-containing protein n=1 Tax=Cohnella soli TaxID=425005 RepID=A0ABW0HZJ6_9BACL
MSMTIQRLCEGIRLDSHARQIVDEYRMDDALYANYKQHFNNDRHAFFERVKQNEAYRQLFLYLFVRFAVDAYEQYRLKGIDDRVYFDTFYDIQIWCMNCKRDYGEYGLEEYMWLQEHVQLRLFALGRLQFQPCAIDREVELDGMKIHQNQLVLNVHIPAGEPLTLPSIEDAFARARAFFRGITPVFMCNSWMLSPRLSEVLPPESNILRFQKLFHIDKVDPDSRDAERFIFHVIKSDVSEYAEQTSLQRKAKAYLLTGDKLGFGFGVTLG